MHKDPFCSVSPHSHPHWSACITHVSKPNPPTLHTLYCCGGRFLVLVSPASPHEKSMSGKVQRVLGAPPVHHVSTPVGSSTLRCLPSARDKPIRTSWRGLEEKWGFLLRQSSDGTQQLLFLRERLVTGPVTSHILGVGAKWVLNG